jgi:hypothetical protein
VARTKKKGEQRYGQAEIAILVIGEYTMAGRKRAGGSL